jgi:alginate O-acetyltransferase complex protein AlgI
MSAYLPHDPRLVALALALLAAELLCGFAVTRLGDVRAARAAAWALTVLATAGVERLCAEEPPGVRMLALIAALFFGMKAVVSAEDRAAGGPRLSAGRWFAFAALWPGMRPGLFARAGGGPLPGGVGLIKMGVRRLALGAALTLSAWLIVHGGRPRTEIRAPTLLASTALLLPGLSLVVHFGAFNILAGAWRLAGVDCRPLFRAPLEATSLTEFWGRRWNLAFSEMTALAVYRPLGGAAGRRAATLGAFLASGVLHELAISLPVRAGYGLPLLYFTLHGALVLAERGPKRAGLAEDRRPWLGRAWTLTWLVLPLPMLFHLPFLRGVVWPLIGVGNG